MLSEEQLIAALEAKAGEHEAKARSFREAVAALRSGSAPVSPRSNKPSLPPSNVPATAESIKAVLRKRGHRSGDLAAHFGVSHEAIMAIIEAPGSGLIRIPRGWVKES
jgi:hypothetical protein